MENNEIKSLNPIECPHCQKVIVIEFVANAPRLTGTYTPEILEAAKQDAISKINGLNLPEELVKNTIDWIKNPDTFFGPGDVDDIIKNLPKVEAHEQEKEAEETAP